MKQVISRIGAGVSLLVLLAACGAGSSAPPATMTAGLVQTTSGSAQAVVNVATATMPAPDCAAEGCARPRIIDGNAEAYRYAAMRRAAAAPQS